MQSARSRCRAPALAAEGIELAPVLGELLALGLDDVRRSVLDEAFIREHLLRPLDLFAQPLDLGGGVAVRGDAVGLDDRVEDPLLVVFEADENSASAEDRRG